MAPHSRRARRLPAPRRLRDRGQVAPPERPVFRPEAACGTSPPADPDGESRGRSLRGTVRPPAAEYLGHHHLRPRGTVRRGWILRPRPDSSREGSRGSVRGRQTAVMHVPILVAYIGPGAGFAFLGSFLTLAAGLAMGAVSALLWPFRALWRALPWRRNYARAKVRKAIVLGLDGFDPSVAERLMDAGKLPNLATLRAAGSYHRLRTTFPALSPVAWSTFATGVNPAKHNIFDFLDRDLRTSMPR